MILKGLGMMGYLTTKGFDRTRYCDVFYCLPLLLWCVSSLESEIRGKLFSF